MTRIATHTMAVRTVIALVAVLALSSLLAGSIAHADTTAANQTAQTWTTTHNNDNHNWNNDNNDNHNWNNDNHNWNHGSWNNNWNNHNWNHGWGWNGGHNWWRWHRIGSQWQQYFDWTLYCQWAAQTYGYASAQCAPYVYSGYNNYGY